MKKFIAVITALMLAGASAPALAETYECRSSHGTYSSKTVCGYSSEFADDSDVDAGTVIVVVLGILGAVILISALTYSAPETEFADRIESNIDGNSAKFSFKF